MVVGVATVKQIYPHCCEANNNFLNQAVVVGVEAMVKFVFILIVANLIIIS